MECLCDLRRPALRQFLERAHVKIAVVKESLERRHEAREEAPILANAVAAHRRAPVLGPGVEEGERLALGGGRVGAARQDPRDQPGAAVLAPIPVVHGLQHLIALMHRDDRPFGEHLEVLVGYDRGDFDDEIGVRLEPGHFKIDPNEIVGGFHR